MEEILPPQTQSGAGFELTRVRQFTIFLDNRVGRLGMLVRTLEEGSARIMALSIEESADSALVRLICSEPDLSRELHAMIHDSQLAMISSAGHLTNLEQPDAFNSIVDGFIRGVDSRG